VRTSLCFAILTGQVFWFKLSPMDDNPTPSSSTGSNKTILYVVVAVVVLALVGGGYAFKHQIKTLLMPGATQPETTTMAPEPAQTTTTAPTTGTIMQASEVDYTATGFSPASITVKKGTIVKFINKSGASMSVASNPHPTHTDYPGFDQGKSDAQGKDEYDFTFDKVGSWGYHNHLKSSDRGTVIVTE